MLGLIKLILSKNLPPIVEGKHVNSAIYCKDPTTSISGLPVIGNSELEFIRKEDFISKGFLEVEDDNFIVFANTNDHEINNYLMKEGSQIVSLLSRLIQYMVTEKISQCLFKEKVYVKSVGSEKYKEDKNLIRLVQNGLAHIVSKAYHISGIKIPNRKNSDEIIFHHQGRDIKLSFWVVDNNKEISLEVLPKISMDLSNLIKLGETKGFVMLNFNMIRHLRVLFSHPEEFYRIAFIGFGSSIDLQKDLVSYFSENTPIENIVSRGFDVYIINLNTVKKDYLLSIPMDSLCILCGTFVDLESSLNYLSLLKSFGNTQPVFTYIVNNLKLILTNQESHLVLDNWSRRLILKDDDTDRVIIKLKTPFIIEDGKTEGAVNIKEEIKKIFVKASLIGASNIDICPGSPIRLYKTKSIYEYYSKVVMMPDVIEVMLLNMISKTKDIDYLYENGELDTSYSVPGIGRYRLSVVRQRSTYAMSIRQTPTKSPNYKQLNLPESFVKRSVEATKGLTMVVGESNSGKSFTLNSIISEINKTKGGIIFMLGNPIEAIHPHEKGLVIQVEIGRDLNTYLQGIAKTLRMNTSVLAFEELRTTQEFQAFSTLINTPNSIYLTLHTGSAKKAIQKLIDELVEAGISRRSAQDTVASALNSVMYQQLIDYKGKRVLIYELVVGTPPIKNLIRNGNFEQFDYSISTDPECVSLDQCIMQRLENGELDFESVKPYIRDKESFRIKGYF